MFFLENALMFVKKVKLINHDCLPILELLHIMLYIMHAYLMLLAAFSNAVCLYDAFFFAIYFCKFFLFSCLVYWYIGKSFFLIHLR